MGGWQPGIRRPDGESGESGSVPGVTNNWVINYRAAYHYLMELQKPGMAADLLMRAYQNGGPDFLPTLASRLWSRVGRAQLGYTTLREFIENNPDSPHLERAKQRLEELRTQLNITE